MYEKRPRRECRAHRSARPVRIRGERGEKAPTACQFRPGRRIPVSNVTTVDDVLPLGTPDVCPITNGPFRDGRLPSRWNIRETFLINNWGGPCHFATLALNNIDIKQHPKSKNFRSCFSEYLVFPSPPINPIRVRRRQYFGYMLTCCHLITIHCEFVKDDHSITILCTSVWVIVFVSANIIFQIIGTICNNFLATISCINAIFMTLFFCICNSHNFIDLG